MAQGLVIGICGGTGSGKTTIAERIVSALPAGNVLVLQQEHYYKDFENLPRDARGQKNFDHPESFDTRLLIQNVRDLRAGMAVERPVYDFSQHKRQAFTARLEPHPAIIVEGILIFESPALRELMDIKIFVDTEADVRFIRRMQRDMRERGRTVDSVVEQYLAAVRPMHQEFIEPCKRYADVILSGGADNGVGIDLVIYKIRAMVTALEGRD
ncbi:MAG: uridine kinase [Acidobacteriia bacterium]|nr:uridine kinase [Terriglobia bacterium]